MSELNITNVGDLSDEQLVEEYINRGGAWPPEGGTVVGVFAGRASGGEAWRAAAWQGYAKEPQPPLTLNGSGRILNIKTGVSCG